MRGLLAALVFASSALGQAYPSNSPYLLRLDHYPFEDHSCALLQSSGDFHLEIDHGDRVKVFEEPIIRSGRYDKLQVTVFRGDGWQDLFFRSSDSQRAFKQSLQPLAHWLDDLHKVPHRELSEDAGKNNCLPRSPIVLQIRGRPPHDEVTAKTRADVLSSNPAPQPTAPDPQTSSMS